jgi:ferredoxin-like protein FixX
VYEPLFEKTAAGVEGRLQINFANCVHCKTCDIMDPYDTAPNFQICGMTGFIVGHSAYQL